MVAENSKPIDGKVVEVVGHYNPADLNKPLVLNKEVISAWIGKGAKPSNTVSKLLNKEGFHLPIHEHPVHPAKKAPKEEPKVVGQQVSGEAGQPETEPVNEDIVAETVSVEEESPAEVVAEASIPEPVVATEPVAEEKPTEAPDA